jgi:hypothetical protein
MSTKSMGPFLHSLFGRKKPADPWDDWRYPFEFFGLEPDASMITRMDGGDPFAEPWLDVIWARLSGAIRRLRKRPAH